ncbi:transferase, partial [Syncephalis pseudoplumigaleata]
MTIKHTEWWIVPSAQVAGQAAYQLSHADYVVGPIHTQRYLCYKNHDGHPNFMPTGDLMMALRKTLDHYPMLYGRLAYREDGECEIQPSSRGVRFVEVASSDSIAAYEPDWPQGAFPPEWQAVTGGTLDATSLFAVRLTRFADNTGLVLCVAYNHYLSDEEGFMPFMKMWSAFVRGDTAPLPSHDRHLLRLASAAH